MVVFNDARLFPPCGVIFEYSRARNIARLTLRDGGRQSSHGLPVRSYDLCTSKDVLQELVKRYQQPCLTEMIVSIAIWAKHLSRTVRVSPNLLSSLSIYKGTYAQDMNINAAVSKVLSAVRRSKDETASYKKK